MVRDLIEIVASAEEPGEAPRLQPPIGLVPAEFTIHTADGRAIKRRSINGRKKITQQFMDEAYTPIVQALAARGQA